MINKNIINAHRHLSDSSVKFLEFVEENTESLKNSSYSLLELNHELYKLQPWPTFINQHIKNKMKEACIKIFNLIKGIPRRVFAYDIHKINQYYGIPIEIIKFQFYGINDEHIDNLFARGDFILSPRGLKCLEYNVSANLGGWELPLWESLYLKTPIISKFIRENNIEINNENLISNLLNHVIKRASVKFSNYDTEINIVIVISSELIGHNDVIKSYLNKIYKKSLQQYREKLTGKILFCGYDHLNVVDDYLFYGDKKIHVLIEMYHGVVPPKILDVFKSGHICLYNGPITGLLSNKLNLALLSENKDSDIFSSEEREVIKKYIPWTRKITSCNTTYGDLKIKLDDFILSNKEKFVIKPSVGYGGKGVYVGKNTSQKQWERIVNKAIKKENYLVQEYIESDSYFYQSGENGYTVHDAVWGFFVLGSDYGGQWLRVMPKENNKGVINCHQGATISVVFEVTG